jgi:hypothetical protein
VYPLQQRCPEGQKLPHAPQPPLSARSEQPKPLQQVVTPVQGALPLQLHMLFVQVSQVPGVQVIGHVTG